MDSDILGKAIALVQVSRVDETQDGQNKEEELAMRAAYNYHYSDYYSYYQPLQQRPRNAKFLKDRGAELKDWYFSPEATYEDDVCTRKAMLRPQGVRGLIFDSKHKDWIPGDKFVEG